MRKFANFYKFYNDFFEQKREFKNHYTIAKSIDIVETDSTISLLGLNSALFSGYDGDDNKKLAFGSHQSEQAFQTQNSDSVLSIAFFHHPFSCFHACEESIQNQIKQHADIILTGHLHDPSNMSQHDGAGKVVIIGAGASYETRDSDNSFNLGVLNLETGEGKVQFYKYLNRSNRWTKNTDINLDDGDDGHFPFIISSIQEKAITLTDRKDKKPNSIEQSKEIEIKQPSPSSLTTQLPSQQVKAPIKIAILTANPINKKYDYGELLHGFKKLKCNVHYHYLNCDTLNELDDYDYIFIMTKLIKNKVVIEDEYLGSRTITLKELEDNIGNTNIKGLFIFLDQEIAPEFISELSLPTVIYPSLSNGEIKKIVFELFKKCKITSTKGQQIANKVSFNLCKLNDLNKVHYYKTCLPDEIDPKKTLNYVGRITDLEILCKKIIDLRNEKNGFLTIKGSGGIGKTMTVKRITVELAARNFFLGGIDFIDCEFITDYKLFEFNLARTFNLEQSLNVKEYIKKHNIVKDALLILDNFETLLHLPDKDNIKSFLNFICDYVTVVVTSRELLEMDCEQLYELRRFTTDEATELFLNEIKRKIDKKDKKLLRNEIIETLLDNNPLAIKLITKNLPKGKSFSALKSELEEDIFEKLTDIELEAFDSYSDTNIERKKSLYASINFSYCYLTKSEKMMFELLSLFPDGIDIENLKHINNENRNKGRSDNKANFHHSCINDKIIHSLDGKSMIENNNGVIRLQSIMGKFAEQKLRQREDMETHYYNAFNYNNVLINWLDSVDDFNEHLALKIFNSHKGNFLKSISYIDKFKYKKHKLLNYIDSVSTFFIQICTNTNAIKELFKKKIFFEKDINEKLLFNLILLNLRYFNGDFERSFQELQEILPKDRLGNYGQSTPIERQIISNAITIYGMEGEAYFSINIYKKMKFLITNIYSGDLFYIGEYNLNLLSSVKVCFMSLEIQLNLDILDHNILNQYLDSIYKKNHIQIISCYYIKAKMGTIDRTIINKLVIVNPYTQGLQQLILAFSETDNNITISLYKEAISNLKHIKYYYVEALFFYAKFLQEIESYQQYKKIYQQGFELAQKYCFRFLIYKFEDLKESKTITYDPKNYPLPDNNNFDDYINFLIKNISQE